MKKRETETIIIICTVTKVGVYLLTRLDFRVNEQVLTQRFADSFLSVSDAMTFEPLLRF